MRAGAMYEAYFRLQRRPFSATPDSSCFFACESIQTVLRELVQRTESGQGICVLTAAAGTGKTLLCRRLLLDLDAAFTPIFLATAGFATRRALFQAIQFELGRRYAGMEEQELRLELVSSLKGLVENGRPAVLIVDEAHLLNERLLEEIRALASLVEGDQPLARVILSGQMALEMKLLDPSLEALNQRIGCHLYLEPLTRQQSRDYIHYRVEWAGGDAARLFDSTAIDLIAEASNGLPRCLNQLCDHSLLLTFVQEAPVVSRQIVENALADLKQLPLHWNESLAAVDDFGLETDGEEGIDDADIWEQSFTSPEELAMRQSGEATAAFEIGSDDSLAPEAAADLRPEVMASECSNPAIPWTSVMPVQPIEVRDLIPPAALPVPASTPTGARIFHEELVDDRYALLDLRSPRVARTFEESSMPEGWMRPQPVHIPQPPAAPVSADTHISPAACDPIVPAGTPIETVGGEHNSRSQAPEESELGFTDCDGEYDQVLLADDADESTPDLEDEISSSVLDVCLEVQNSLSQWWDSKPGANVAGGGDGSQIFENRTAPQASQYDVVEPDRESSSPMDSAGQRSAGSGSAGRYIPRPNYRNVFSTLRRRIGRAERPLR
ncbi:MAG TPA: AAA family ATPase [Planctomycetaceae bacterium]|nr:AAA family ATPase [Planctomycetaceae bacterium]